MLPYKDYPSAIATLFISLLLGTISPLLQAQDEEEARWYQMEIILFEHTGSGNIDSEKWPLEHGMPALDKVAELVAPNRSVTDSTTRQGTVTGNEPPSTQARTTYPLLDQSEMQLTGIYQKLQRSSRHRPILHLAWRQPTVEKEATIPVHIHGGMQYERPRQSLESLIEGTATGTPTYAPVTGLTQGTDSAQPGLRQPPYSGEQHTAGGIAAAGQEGGNAPTPPGTVVVTAQPAAHLLEQIDGTITISRARYLHVWTDLIYRTPNLPQGYLSPGEEIAQAHAAPPDTAATTTGQPTGITAPGYMDTESATEQVPLFSLRIQDHRRMRSKEIHYMDHPLVGMIILATPYELPKPAPEPVSETPATTPETPTENTAGNGAENSSAGNSAQ